MAMSALGHLQTSAEPRGTSASDSRSDGCLFMSARPSRDLRQYSFRKLLEHDPVALRGEMVVAEDVEMLVPVLVGIACREEHREQVDEGLAVTGAEIAP